MRLGVKVTTTPASKAHGAIAGDRLLDKTSFIQWIRNTVDKAYVDSAVPMLNQILSYRGITSQYSTAFQLWRVYEQSFLGNNVPTALMVFAGFTSDKAQLMSNNSTTISQRMDQMSGLTNSGLLINNAGKDLLNVVASQKLMRHYNNLMQTVQYGQVTSDPVTFDQIETDDYYVQYDNMRNAIKYRLFWNDNPDKSYRQVIYGRMGDDQFRGQVADAFVNHLGAMHQSLFQGGGLSASNILITAFERSVRDEEGRNFLQRLVDSRNSTHWMTGGDLNLVDQDSNVLARIQLKTVRSKDAAYVGRLTHHRFFKLIEAMKTTLENLDVESYANLLYNKLKTSAFMKQMGEQAATIGTKLMQQNY